MREGAEVSSGNIRRVDEFVRNHGSPNTPKVLGLTISRCHSWFLCTESYREACSLFKPDNDHRCLGRAIRLSAIGGADEADFRDDSFLDLSYDDDLPAY